jgi:tetratricopeptide (TPR) repeat protein
MAPKKKQLKSKTKKSVKKQVKSVSKPAKKNIAIDLKIANPEKSIDLSNDILLAITYNSTNDFDKAEKAIDKVLSVTEDGWAMRVKGDILLAQQKSGVFELYKKAVEILENNKVEQGYAYFGLAKYYLALNDKKKAMENAEKACEINNDEILLGFLNNLK